MTLMQIAETLKSQGVAINYRQRKDGSIVITRIDGVSYQNKSGNAKARALLGETLSSARSEQLQKIRTPKGKWGHKKESRLDNRLKKELRKVQSQFRKKGVTEGKPTMRNLRYILKHYGMEEAFRKLRQASRYARGIAYPENVDAFAFKLIDTANKLNEMGRNAEARKLKHLAKYLKRHRDDDTITEEMLSSAIEAVGSPVFSSIPLDAVKDAIETLYGIFGL